MDDNATTLSQEKLWDEIVEMALSYLADDYFDTTSFYEAGIKNFFVEKKDGFTVTTNSQFDTT